MGVGVCTGVHREGERTGPDSCARIDIIAALRRKVGEGEMAIEYFWCHRSWWCGWVVRVFVFLVLKKFLGRWSAGR